MDFFALLIQSFNAGGILMYPLLLLAIYLYFSGFEICFRMRRWNKICSNKKSFDCAFATFTKKNFSESADTAKIFSHLRLTMMAGVERRITTLKILSSVAPLIGLLGTVMGMMLCISSTADSSGVADGISTALITTQAGLVVAIPAWIITMFASAQTQKLMINLAKKESEILKAEVVL